MRSLERFLFLSLSLDAGGAMRYAIVRRQLTYAIALYVIYMLVLYLVWSIPNATRI